MGWFAPSPTSAQTELYESGSADRGIRQPPSHGDWYGWAGVTEVGRGRNAPDYKSEEMEEQSVFLFQWQQGNRLD